MEIINTISTFAIPCIIVCILAIGFYKKVKLYDVFIESSRDGLSVLLRIIPNIVGFLVAIGIFRASGVLDGLVYTMKPLTDALCIPSEVLPLAILRPISGSASIALMSDMLRLYGPDTYLGRVISTMMGSTETIFYTLAVYFGSVGIKNVRYTLIAALIAEVVSIISSTWICKMVL